jgi:hypothetical protein
MTGSQEGEYGSVNPWLSQHPSQLKLPPIEDLSNSRQPGKFANRQRGSRQLASSLDGLLGTRQVALSADEQQEASTSGHKGAKQLAGFVSGQSMASFLGSQDMEQLNSRQPTALDNPWSSPVTPNIRGQQQVASFLFIIITTSGKKNNSKFHALVS